MAKASTGSLRRTRRVRNEINVVPYIDVMLVLLIIFMVTAPLVTPSAIDLPAVGQAQHVDINPLEIHLDKNGRIQVRDRELNEQTFRSMERKDLVIWLQQKQQAQAEQAVVIGADKKIPYEQVIELLDTLQKQGIKRVGLLVKQTAQ